MYSHISVVMFPIGHTKPQATIVQTILSESISTVVHYAKLATFYILLPLAISFNLYNTRLQPPANDFAGTSTLLWVLSKGAGDRLVAWPNRPRKIFHLFRHAGVESTAF